MIRPSTTVFALLTADPQDEWLARLYNALFGFNGLDAAAVVFTLRALHVDRVLKGLLDEGRAHFVHVAPSLWQAAAEAVRADHPFVDAIDPRTGPRFEHVERLVRFAQPHPLSLVDEPPPHTPSAALAAALRQAGVERVGGEWLVDASLPTDAPWPLPPTFPPPRPAAARGDRTSIVLAGSWHLVHERRRAWPESIELGPSFQLFVQRAGDELAQRFGVEPRAPADLAQALVEPNFRPCQLLDDGFRAAYPHLGAPP